MDPTPTPGDAPGAPLDSLVAGLSPRRLEVLELVAKGLTNDDVARVLGISAGTVRNHVSSVLTELHVANRTEATTAYLAWRARPKRVDEILARPAIAVVPFVALDAAEQAKMAALAVTQDLTTLFARWCWFPVIAAAATCSACDAGGTPREVGTKLGARFVVTGTLRTKRSSWRITVRIDDVEDGVCRWAERYDFADDDLFDVQDAVCEAIVATAYDVLIKGLAARVLPARHPGTLDAWTLAHEGMSLYAARESGSNSKARERFSLAVERDPNLVLAHFGLGLCHYDEVLNQWGDAGAPADRLQASAERCIELAPHAAEGYFLLGRHQQARGRHAHAVEPLTLAVAQNPSFAPAHALLAQLLVLSGRPDEGLQRAAHARRLAPKSYVAGMAAFHFLRGEHAQALEHATSALATNPSYTFGLAIAAASAWWLGDVASAHAHARALRAHHPRFSPARFLATFGSGFEGVERVAKALDALGLEHST